MALCLSCGGFFLVHLQGVSPGGLVTASVTRLRVSEGVSSVVLKLASCN